MRSQIARMQEKIRTDGIERGQIVLVGDRTRARLAEEMAALSRFPSDGFDGWTYWGEVAINGIRFRPLDA